MGHVTLFALTSFSHRPRTVTTRSRSAKRSMPLLSANPSITMPMATIAEGMISFMSVGVDDFLLVLTCKLYLMFDKYMHYFVHRSINAIQ